MKTTLLFLIFLTLLSSCIIESKEEQKCIFDTDCDGYDYCNEEGFCKNYKACIHTFECEENENCIENKCRKRACILNEDCPENE